MGMNLDGSPSSSDVEVELDDLDIVACDEMETVDSDDQDSSVNQLDVEEGVEFFTPPRDDAVAVLKGHKESVFCVTIDPTGTFLASGGQDHVAIVWDVASGQMVFTTEGHEDSVTCVTFSWDGNYLATGDMAGTIRVWLRPTGNASSSPPWTLIMSQSVGDLLWLRWWQPSPANKQQAGAVNSDGPRLAVLAAGDEDGLVSVWSVNPPSVRTSKSIPNKVKYFASSGFAAIAGTFYLPSIATDRPKLVVLYKDSVLRLWDLKSEEILTSIRIISNTHHHTETDDPTDDVAAETEMRVFCLAQPHPGTDTIYQQQTDLIVIGGQDCLHMVVINQDKQDGSFLSKCLPSIQVTGCGSVEAVDFSWTHPFFAFGTVSGTICIVDSARMRIRQKWTYHDANDETNSDVGITSLLWSQTCPVFFTSASNGAVLAWHGLSGAMELGCGGSGSEPAPLRIWWGHTAMVLDTALPPPTITDAETSSDKGDHLSHSSNKARLFERFVASASDDATVRIYSTQDVFSNQ